MSEPRINLAELRALVRHAETPTRWELAQAKELGALLGPPTLLALVEAVEAAQESLKGGQHTGPCSGGWHEECEEHVAAAGIRHAALIAALAPFTDETTSPLRAPSAREPLASPKKHSEEGS